MDFDILLQKLKHGDSITQYDAEGKAVGIELRPPNKHMLAAARVIEQLAQQLQHNQHYMNQLNNERNQLIAELEQLKHAQVRDTDTATAANAQA